MFILKSLSKVNLTNYSFYDNIILQNIRFFMLENKKTQPFLKRLLKSKLLITLEVVILFLLSIALAKEIIRNYQIESEIDALKNEIESLEKENLELADLIQYFKTETFKEEQAKSRLGMMKEGEKVVALPRTEGISEYSEEEDYVSDSSKLVSNPQKWWDYFFD